MMPATKYISIFEVDGEPILPPLMTLEKRFEMQMYREKAIQLERKYISERHGRRVQFCETPISESACGQLSCINSENASLRSSDVDEEDKPNLSERSSSSSKPYSLTGCNPEVDKTLIDCGTNTLSMANDDDTKKRMRKLSKSKTICFDNTSNTIIRAMTEEEIEYTSGKAEEKSKEMYLCEMVQNFNLDSNTQSKKSLHLPLMQQSIPSIYVNPPTPLTGPNTISESLSATESVDSYDTSGFQSSQATQNQALEITEDSAEESTENAPPTPQKRITSTARTLHFEQMQNELKNTSPPSELRGESGDNSSELCFAMRSPQRSATSPSLKSLSDTVGTSSLTTSPRIDDNSAHSLVRSSSFTLEGPSKVLLDHIRQQGSDKKSPDASRQNINKQRSSPSPSALRDTVESKAKRVQKKVEVKSKPRSVSNARLKSKSFNNYSSNTAPLWNSPVPPLKVKRSPYDGKGAPPTKPPAAKASNAHKNPYSSKAQKSHAVKKSSSSTTYTVKQVASRSSLPNNTSNTNIVADDARIMAEIDQRHHQKLLTLIAEQQEEQRRLQQAFETQQKILMEQLNNERCRSFHMEVDHSRAALYSQGVPNTLPIQSNIGNPHNVYNDENVMPFQRPSPAVNVNSSFAQSEFGLVSGFTTTRTYELPFNVPSIPINRNSALQRPIHMVDLPSVPYANSGAVNGNMAASNFQQPHSPQLSKENVDPDIEQLNTAATVINAHARGFLVRRLFQTEQIQRIVQTIRDTLIFVLNLHMETMENPEEANTASNIKLKARLLQQLSSACRTLHLIFFQTSIKERMEIISRDRKRIKTKLLSMSLKRSPRIA